MEYTDILHFWFKTLDEDEWFRQNETVDKTIKERFLNVHKAVHGGKTSVWRTSPQGALAEVIVLDQFSRNMFRDTAEMFAYDALALARAEEALEKGFDIALPKQMRAFLYMPYMHSESRDVHTKALALFESLGDAGYLKYEHLHKKIIDRFGRYPHRNNILGRTSTEEERTFLETDEHASF